MCNLNIKTKQIYLINNYWMHSYNYKILINLIKKMIYKTYKNLIKIYQKINFK